MTYELSTNVTKIDLHEIFDNILNREYWKKTWIIFDYDTVFIDVKLYSIDVSLGTWTLSVHTTDLGVIDTWDQRESSLVSSQLDGRDLSATPKYILRAIKRDLLRLEEARGTETAEHRALKASDTEQRNQHKEELRKFCIEEEGVTNEEIIEAYVERHAKHFREAGKFLDTCRDNLLAHVSRQIELMIEFEEVE